jgi:diguanylate cyclase (GGDEF)-like protein/PAS domain S-box-containing protein
MSAESASAAVLQGILDTLPEPYVRLEVVRNDDGAIVDFAFVDANQAACDYNRLPRERLIGSHLLDLLPGHRGSDLMAALVRVVETGDPLAVDDFVYDNELLGRVVRTDLRAMRTGDGLSLIWRDVTEAREAAEALASSEERFRLLAENASDVVIHMRGDRLAWVSPSVERMLGWHPEELAGREVGAITHPEDAQQRAADARDASGTHRARMRLIAADGSYHWFDAHSGPLIRPDGHEDGRVATFRLIDAEVAAEEELERRARYDQLTGLMSRTEILGRIAATGHHARRTGEHNAVLFCDIDKFKVINDTFGHAAGDEVLRVIGQRLTACVRSNDVVARIGGDELLILLTGLHGLDDAAAVAEKIRANAAYPIPVGDAFISATLSIGVALAVPGEGVDPLIARADDAMFRAKQAGRDQVIAIPSPLSVKRVLVVDDDDFMLEIVDELLRQAGVREVMQASDGSAALAIVDNEITSPDVVLCDVNMAGMDGIELLRHLADREYRGSVIVMSGSGDDLLASVGDLAVMHGLRLSGLLRKPIDLDDLIKALDSGEHDPMAPSIDEVKGVRVGRLTPEEVRAGIDNGCVDVHLQPKVALADHSVVGVEALLRWRDPVRGMLSPLAIVPIAESHGLIEDLTLAVYRRVIEILVQWRAIGIDLKVAVNLSADNLASLDLPDTLTRIAQDAGISPNRIVLEITEHRLMDRLAVSLEVIGRLRLKGFGVSIDDYGMGYSNLRKLKQLPITELKVDRSFVSGADRDSVLRVILGSSVALGHSLDLTVVGEGVETKEVWDLLHALGCDEAQGYFVARPMPAADLPAWKQAWDETWG